MRTIRTDKLQLAERLAASGNVEAARDTVAGMSPGVVVIEINNTVPVPRRGGG